MRCPSRSLNSHYRGWERFFAAVGPDYGQSLRQAMGRVRAELTDADDEQLAELARDARVTAGSLDEEDARLTVRLHGERDRHADLAASLDREADQLLEDAPRGWSARRRAEGRTARTEAAERRERAAAHRRQAAETQEQIRVLDQQGRHLYGWFERHRDTLARGLAAEQRLNTFDRAAYHVLGAPGIASLTARSLTAERAIDLSGLEDLVEREGDERQRLLLDVAIELCSGSERQVMLDELVGQLHGEDLDRVLEGIAIRRRRPFRGKTAPTDLWIRAAEPDRDRPE